jgi:hypothetical protein
MFLHTPIASCLVCISMLQSAAAQDAVSPRFVLHGKDGRVAPAKLLRLGPNWSIETAAATVPAPAWAGLQQEGWARPAPLTHTFVALGNGDRMPLAAGRPMRLDEGRLFFTPAEPLHCQKAEELSLFAPHVALILLAVPEGVDDVERFVARLRKEPRDTDVLLLRNGDRIEGKVKRLDGKTGCEILADGQTVRTAWPKLAGIAFATSSVARPRPKKTHALAVLAGGARLHFASLNFDLKARRWSGRTTSGADVTVAEQALIALDLLGGPAVYLSDLAPLRYKAPPYLGVRWPIGEDISTAGRPLRVGDSTYDKGVGLHGPCRLTYRLDGKYSWFEATVGLDPSAGIKGRARLAVIVDGKEHRLGEGKERTAHDAPLSVGFDVRGARELTLAADLGSLGDVQCHVNWGNARLFKSGN